MTPFKILSSHYCNFICTHALRRIISENSILLFRFFLLSTFAAFFISTFVVLLGSCYQYRLCLFFGINLSKYFIYQPLIILISSPPSHVVLRDHGNLLHQFTSCLIHRNYLVIPVELILHCVLRYEPIISKSSAETRTSNYFLVTGSVRKVAFQKHFQYWIITERAESILASFLCLRDSSKIMPVQPLLHY